MLPSAAVRRSYYSATLAEFCAIDRVEILGRMARQNSFDLTLPQRDAWLEQIEILQRVLAHRTGRLYLEFSIPRMGRRIDALAIIGPVIFVLEFKVGEDAFSRQDVDQVIDYALDLHNFHEGSHKANIAPILICTNAHGDRQRVRDECGLDGMFDVSLTNADGLGTVIDRILSLVKAPDVRIDETSQISRLAWMSSFRSLVGSLSASRMSRCSRSLKKHGVAEFSDPDAFFDLFYDEDIRFEYILAFNKLTRAFNLVLPRKEALEYFHDYQSFCEINALASKHLQDDRLSMKGIPPKLRAITDEFLKSKGVTQKIAPISILDADFQKEVKTHTRSKTKAAEVEHAIRHFIDVNIDEDPALFASFATELERILQEFKDKWDRIFEELEKLRQKILAKEKEQSYGLDRKKQMPIFRMLRADLLDDGELSEDEIAQVVNLTQHVFNEIAKEVISVGFWSSTPAQNRLKAELQHLLLSEEFSIYPHMLAKWRPLISRLMEWARENDAVIKRP
jgi:hypothetical protein